MAQLLALGMGGSVRTTIIRAVNREDLGNILAMLP
jgi:hypothetical protein